MNLIMQQVVGFTLLSFFSFALPLFPHLSMQRLTMGSLNIHGGRDANKRALVSEVVSQKNIDVFFLRETHTIIADEVDWGLWWEGAHILSHGTNLCAGVAILFKSQAVILSST